MVVKLIKVVLKGVQTDELTDAVKGVFKGEIKNRLRYSSDRREVERYGTKEYIKNNLVMFPLFYGIVNTDYEDLYYKAFEEVFEEFPKEKEEW